SRLDEVKDTIQLKGFRRGKVPPNHIRKVYGRSLMAEIVQKAVEESTEKAIAERQERPAFEPRIEFPEDQAEIERVMEGQGDLASSVSFEVLPDFKVSDLSALELERLVADVPEEEIAKAIETLAARNVTYTPEEGREAAEGDQVTLDFVGRID